MFVRIIEIVLILSLLFLSCRIVRHSFPANLLRFAQRVICIVLGVTGGILAFGPLGSATSNFVLQFLLAYAVGMALCFMTAVCLSQLALRLDWSQRFEKFVRLPRWLDRAIVVATLLVFWLTVLICVDITGRFISIYPTSRAAAGQSLVMRHFVEQPERDPFIATAATQYRGEQDRVLEALAAQAEFSSLFIRGLRQSSDKVLDVTGTDTLLMKLNEVQQILNLSQDENRWVLQQNPQLMRLSDHPAIQRIANNDALLAQLERVSAGSLASVYRLGDDPDVRLLLEDPDVRRAIYEFDTAEILTQLQAYRQTGDSETAGTSNDSGR